MNGCLQETALPEWKTKGKTILIQEDPPKGTAPNNYRPLTCQPMMWKILTQQIREICYSVKSWGFVPRRKERMPQVNQRNWRSTIHWSTHPQGEQNKTKKCCYGMDWLQKGIRYGPAKLNNRLSQNVQNIQRSHKVHRENHEKQESGTESRRKKLSRGANPERNLPGRWAFTFTICNSGDATESHT